MSSKLTPFLFLSLALHVGVLAYFQSKSVKVPSPSIKPNKASVHTIYLQEETQKKIATSLPKKPIVKASLPKKVSPPKPLPSSQKTALKASPPKKSSSVAKAKEKADNPSQKGQAFSHAYAEEIATQLKLLLSLPEYGEVKVSMQLMANGLVSKVEIIESQSATNEKYLLEMLPKLTLPPPPNGETPIKLTLSNA